MKINRNAIALIASIMAANTSTVYASMETKSAVELDRSSYEEQPPCTYEEARKGITKTDTLQQDTETCKDRLSNVSEVLETARSFITPRYQLALAAGEIHDDLSRYLNRGEKAAAIAKAFGLMQKLPGPLGKVFTFLYQAMKKTDALMEKLSEETWHMNDVELRIKKYQSRVSLMESITKNVGKASGGINSALTTGVSLSSSSPNCPCREVLETFAESKVNADVWEIVHETYGACAAFVDVDIKIPPEILEFLDKIIQVVEAIKRAIANITKFIEDVFDKIQSELNYLKCCTGTGVVIGTIIEEFTDVLSVVSCWAGPLIDGLADAALAPLLETLQALIDGSFNAWIDVLNDDVIPKANDALSHLLQYEADYTYLGNDFKLAGCDIGKGSLPSLRLSLSFDDRLPLISPITITDDDRRSIADIGDEIAESCKEAANALKDKRAANCCPMARVAVGIDPDGIDNGDRCNSSMECASWRCDKKGGLFSSKICQAPLKDCASCNENTDCNSRSCRFGKCANIHKKICTGNQCGNAGSSACQSGRCDASSGGLSTKFCLNKLSDCSSCNENTDCYSGSCRFGKCANIHKKICTGNQCGNAGSSACQSGRCDATSGGTKFCLNKLSDCSSCNENTDCYSGSCRFGKCANSRNLICTGNKCGNAGSSACQSGRCDASSGSFSTKYCYDKLNSGSWCNENNDCKSGNCKKPVFKSNHCASSGANIGEAALLLDMEIDEAALL